MARSVGPVGVEKGLPEPGVVTNPRTGTRYEVTVEGGGAWLHGRTAEGGVRSQRIVGRIGAGLYDTSWVTVEVDPVTGGDTGRLFFAPLETVTGRGLTLSPFELYPGSPGLDMTLTEGCLTCHTDTDPETLPSAQAAANRRSVYPGNALGADAFEVLQPHGCGACHGDTARHRALVTAEATARPGEGLGIVPLADQPVAARRDVCARCHLQGDARFELVEGRPDLGRPLAGQVPVLVPVKPQDDFRFVGQVEQLAGSACFRGSPQMTCATCHEPHTAVAAQGVPSFDAACQRCHGEEPAGHRELRARLPVEQVSGRPARSAAGCVDCHVAYGQPVDLPHVVTADHRIRRLLPAPRGEIPHRQFLDPQGPVEVFDDGRLAPLLAQAGGERWRRGVLAMGLTTLARFDEAGRHFDAFPPPGSPAARQPTAPAGLEPLETQPTFHHLRALVLQSQGRFPEALAAYGDALELDPERAGVRIDRARLRLLLGDQAGLVDDTGRVIAAHRRSDQPWTLRAELALKLGRPDMAVAAFEEAARAWPASAVVWYSLAELRRLLGDGAGADEALVRAQALAPSGPPRPSAPTPGR
jgi:hypothetical protein